MKNFLLYVLLFALSTELPAQNLEWAVRFGGIHYETALDLALDSKGNVYTAGAFQHTVDFDPGLSSFNLTSKGHKDVYISKLNPAGELVWAKQIGGFGREEVRNIAISDSGFIYLTGEFTDTLDFDPNMGVAIYAPLAHRESFLLKLDTNGNFIWVKTFTHNSSTNSGYSNVHGMSLDEDHNVLLTGYFSGSLDFDPNEGRQVFSSNPNSSSVFVLKLNPQGNLIWAKSIDGNYGGFTYGSGIDIDSLNNVYVVGSFNGTPDFNPGPSVYRLNAKGTDRSLFILKLDQFGNFVWAKGLIGKFFINSPKALAVDPVGHTYLSGSFLYRMDFDPGSDSLMISSAGSMDAFVLKLSPSGQLIWAKTIGGSESDGSSSISLDQYGNQYITGNFSGTVDFDLNSTSASYTSVNHRDVYILKLDPSGQLAWVGSYGGRHFNNSPNSLIIDNQENVYTVGRFSDTSDFDPGPGVFMLNAYPMGDIFIQKLSQTAPVSLPEIDQPFRAIIYPNPTTGMLSINFGSSALSGEIALINSVGELALRTIFTNSIEVEIEIEGPPGIYLLQISTDQGAQILRFLKK